MRSCFCGGSCESETAHYVKGHRSVIDYLESDSAKLRRAIVTATRRGGYYYRPNALPGLRRRLAYQRAGWAVYRAKLKVWEGTASETTRRRLHWIYDVERFRGQIQSAWSSIEREDASIAYHEEAIREGCYTKATRRAYAQAIVAERTRRAETLTRLQNWVDVGLESYWTWWRDANSREPGEPAANPEPRLRVIMGGRR